MSEIKDKLFSEVFEDFLIYSSKRLKKQSFEALTRNFKIHILPYFKEKYVNKITKTEIIEWQNKIIDKNFCNSFNSTLYYNFSSFFHYCVLNSYIKENIVLSVGNFKKKTEVKEYDYYVLHEFRRFRKYLKDNIIKQYFNFIYFNGTRPSETLALRFCDLKGKFIHVRHNLQRRGKRELDTPKNQSSVRYLKLSWLQRFRIFLLKCYYMKHYDNFSEEFYIFGGAKPLSTSTIDRRKEEACKKAHIRKITQHQFRHSYATNMIHKRKSIDEVSKNLGHSKVSMTVDTYLHTKKRVTSTLSSRLKFFETLSRNFKNLTQSIITLFM